MEAGERQALRLLQAVTPAKSPDREGNLGLVVLGPPDSQHTENANTTAFTRPNTAPDTLGTE